MKRRWLILGFSWLIFFIAFMDRVNLSVAMPFISNDFSLTPQQTGYLLSAFFITYTLCQIPGGILGDKFGPKIVMTGAFIWWSVMTVVTGLARGFAQFYAVRVIFGLGEGVHFPCAFKLNSNWFPNKERATANSVFTSANSLGPAIAPSIAVAIIATFGWRSVFYIFGAIGFIIIPFWIHFIHNKPSDDKHISPQELHYITSGQSETVDDDAENEKLSSVFKNKNVWLIAIAYCSFLCAFYGLMTWLPTYLLKARGYELVKMGIFAGLPFLSLGLAQPLGGWFSDHVLKGRRKIQVIVASLMAAPAFMGVLYSRTETGAMASLVIAGFIMGLAFGPFFSMAMESVKRKFAGTATGIMNTGGNVGGIISPIIIGYLVAYAGYDAVFMFMIATQVLTALIIFFVSEHKKKIPAGVLEETV